MTINELIDECNSIFNTLDSSSTLSTSSSSSIVPPNISKDKLLAIHGIIKRNEALMEELRASTIEDTKFKIIKREIYHNMSEIVRMYQDFERIAVS